MTSEFQGFDRRSFLRVGGLGIGLVALTAACVNTPEDEQITQTGTRIPAPATSVPPFPGTAVLDAQLVLTALSVEKLTIETYETVLKEPWITDEAVKTVARRVIENHRTHVSELTSLATSLGQKPDEVGPNAAVKEGTVDSEIEAVKAATTDSARATDAVLVLTSLEDALAQLYTRGGGTMTTPELRTQMTSFAVATARHYTVLAKPAGAALVPLAFMPTAAAGIPEDGFIQVDPSTVKGNGNGATPGTATTTTTVPR